MQKAGFGRLLPEGLLDYVVKADPICLVLGPVLLVDVLSGRPQNDNIEMISRTAILIHLVAQCLQLMSAQKKLGQDWHHHTSLVPTYLTMIIDIVSTQEKWE